MHTLVCIMHTFQRPTAVSGQRVTLNIAVFHYGALVHSGIVVNGLGQIMPLPSVRALSRPQLFPHALKPCNALQTGRHTLDQVPTLCLYMTACIPLTIRIDGLGSRASSLLEVFRCKFLEGFLTYLLLLSSICRPLQRS